jgi:nucleotide-binding universal stress UspA family protein
MVAATDRRRDIMTTASSQDPATAPYVILAALSKDETGEYALFEAASVAASRPRSELHVVYVADADDAAESRDLISLERELARAPAALDRQVQRLQAHMPSRVTAHVRAGQPARSILQTAIDVNADLIVIGTHHHTPLAAMLVGSVSERVLRDAHCPVLVAMPKDYEGATKSESIEPPCAECIVARQQSHNQTFWCERHSRAYNQPHVYDPSERGRSMSVMPTH